MADEKNPTAAQSGAPAAQAAAAQPPKAGDAPPEKDKANDPKAGADRASADRMKAEKEKADRELEDKLYKHMDDSDNPGRAMAAAQQLAAMWEADEADAPGGVYVVDGVLRNAHGHYVDKEGNRLKEGAEPVRADGRKFE